MMMALYAGFLGVMRISVRVICRIIVLPRNAASPLLEVCSHEE
jgi:hypothetical protein